MQKLEVKRFSLLEPSSETREQPLRKGVGNIWSPWAVGTLPLRRGVYSPGPRSPSASRLSQPQGSLYGVFVESATTADVVQP
eukprot:6081958-Prymnesium_polylepis.1